jgi:hypothetical protein
MKRRRAPVCPYCYTVLRAGDDRCLACRARVSWRTDDSVELHVTGVADEVESVTRRLAAGLAPSRETTGKVAERPSSTQDRWTRSRKAWAFTIGLATVVGALAAVLTLVVHLLSAWEAVPSGLLHGLSCKEVCP